jgi:hypothetical protein
MVIAGPNGPREITVRGSRTASKVARYKADVNRFLSGDSRAISKWHGKKIAGLELVTDPNILIDQAEKDLLPYGVYRALIGGRS